MAGRVADQARSEALRLLREITQFHGRVYLRKAKRDIPEFRCEIDFVTGAKTCLDDIRRRGKWKDGVNDALYNQMVPRR